jgi:hypothetical protein
MAIEQEIPYHSLPFEFWVWARRFGVEASERDQGVIKANDDRC